MAIDPKDPRVTDPKFSEFEDLVCHVLDKRDAKRKEESDAAVLEEAKKKPKFPFFYW